MASIKSYHLKNGEKRYEVQGYKDYQTGNGQQHNFHKRGFKSFDEANNWAKQQTSEFANNTASRKYQMNMTVEEWLTDWIENFKINVKEGSMIIYRYNVRKYLIPNIGQYKLRQYTPAVHQRFILSMLRHGGKNGSPLSYNTVNIIQATLNNALQKAVKLDIIPNNPALQVEFPRDVKVAKQQVLHYWTIEQTEVFLEQAKREQDPVWYIFFLTILDLGLRKGEAMALQWQDIDFAENTIDINKTRLYRAEVGDNVNQIIVDDPKFPASNRKLFMTERLRDALIEFNELFYGTHRNIIQLDKHETRGTDDLVFRYSWSKREALSPLKGPSTNLAFNRIIKRADLPKIKIHDLRHTHAVFLRESGVSLEDIMSILGHKDIATTQIYAEISPKVIKSASEKYNQYISK